MVGRSKCAMLKNLSFGVIQESRSSQTSWVLMTSGTGFGSGWSSQGMTTSPGLVGKALADRAE